MAFSQGRKASDRDIVALNCAGVSLARIGHLLGIHHTTAHKRLRSLGVAQLDCRRAFMDDVFEQLTPGQQRWLLSRMGAGTTIKDLIRDLLVREFSETGKSRKG